MLDSQCPVLTSTFLLTSAAIVQAATSCAAMSLLNGRQIGLAHTHTHTHTQGQVARRPFAETELS